MVMQRCNDPVSSGPARQNGMRPLTSKQARGGGWRASMASGERVKVEAQIHSFDGEYRWLLVRTNLLGIRP